MPNCFVPGCSFSWRTHHPDTTLHVFPKKEHRIKSWLDQLGFKEKEKNFLVPEILSCKKGKYRVCSLHFDDQDFVTRGTLRGLKSSAVPNQRLPPSRELIIDELSEHSYSKRPKLDTYEEHGTESTDEPEVASSSPSGEVNQLEELEEPTTPTSESPPAENIILEDMEFENVSQESILQTTEKEEVEVNIESAKKKSLKRKKKGPPQEMSTKGTNTEYFPGQKHKSTQTQKNIGVKQKCIQVSFRNPQCSIAIQCEMVILPPLSLCSASEDTEDGQQRPLRLEESLLQPSFCEGFSKQNPQISTDPSSLKPLNTRFGGYLLLLPTCTTTKSPPTPEAPSSTIEQTTMLQQPAKKQRPAKTKRPAKPQRPAAPQQPATPQQPTVPQQTIMDEGQCPTVKEEEEYPKETEDENLIDPSDPDSSFIRMPFELGSKKMATERKFIVFESCLNKLFLNCRCQGKSDCPGYIAYLKKYCVGSALVVTGFCSENHKFHLWSSQPFIGKMPAGNLLISSALLCSGCNFHKISNFFNVLSLAGISHQTHCNNKKKCIYPTIHYHWLKERSNVLAEIRGKCVALAGDGQYDSPGSSAKYCTYTFLDAETEKILDFQVEQIKTGIPLVSLEKKAFQLPVDRLIREHVKIKIIATDRHIGICKIMKERYKNICHEFDIWRLAKSIGHKIHRSSLHSNAKELASWVSPTKNHLWWSASTCHRNVDLLKEKWMSIIYHAANIHEWSEGTLYKACSHPPVLDQDNEEHAWLLGGSAAHQQLKKIIMDVKLLKDLNHLSNVCHTENLDVYHSIALKYRSKRHHFEIDSVVARTELAALNYNRIVGRKHTNVQQLRLTNGQLGKERFPFSYSKAKKDWIDSKVYEETTQELMIQILSDVVSFVSGEIELNWTPRHSGEPKNITPLPCPEKSDMLQKYLSCFHKQPT
ncbi:uncharacterized protein LOC120935917 [Rana temporaria]|uniref:uncharacterized protein LOC120935917 n=1 Tax=Rana temporaria TaxID=8407 RepID=UPI001AAC52E2|nr:uncharacterized protein LOC120935917 [Rana temporaria]XP_040203881.1 uncharacterized protein LOC120935917 [Rana temporaria]